MKRRKIYNLLLIFFLTSSIFTSMFISTPNNNIIVSADSQVWENEYGKLEVEPATSTNLIRQLQYYNLTWYYPSNTVDIAFGFNDSLSYGSVYYWDGDSYNKINVDHVEYDSDHFYVLNNINVNQDETKHGYWEYDIPVGSSGKWDMYAKLSSDSWSTAFSTGRIIHLDPWWNSSWGYFKQITVDSSQVPSTLTNFPILVNITDTDLRDDAQNDGDDIAFTLIDNVTQLNHEIESFNGTTGQLFAWINITSLPHDSDLVFNMYYGNGGASNQQNVAGTWDSNFTMVQHMNGTNYGTIDDSTSNNRDVTGEGGNPTYQQTGSAGYAVEFDGNDYLQLDYNFSYTGSFMVEAWVYLDGAGEELQPIINTEDGTVSDGGWSLAWQLSTTKFFVVMGDGATNWDIDYGSAHAAGSWYYVVGVWTAGNLYLYINADSDELSYSRSYTNSVGVNARMARYAGVTANRYLDGLIDDIRISNIVRSNDWILTCYNTINNATVPGFIKSVGSETLQSDTNAVTNFTATTTSSSSIFLNWTNSTNGNYTLIERGLVTEYWDRGSGIEIYNDTNNNYTDSGLTISTVYYYQAWAFNESTGNFSASAYANNHTGPINPSNIDTVVSSTTINFTWTKGTRADNTVIIRKTDSYPSSSTDGTEIYNGSATGYDDTSFTAASYYRLFSYNTTNNLFSSGVNAEWGVLQVRVYDENTSEIIYNYTVFITNQDGSSTYEIFSNNTQVVNIDIGNLPTGEDVVVKINATSYEDRIYTMDIYSNNFYNLSAYLPQIVDSYLYRLTVIGPIEDYNTNPPIEDAQMTIKRYINSTVGYENIGIYISDGDGNIFVYLIPGNIYKITITATGYVTSISDFIPFDNVFTQNFRLAVEPFTPTTYDIFWEYITFSASIDNPGCMQDSNITISFSDGNNSITNTNMIIYEIDPDGTSLAVGWYNSTSISWSNITSGINHTRRHRIVLFFNSSSTYQDETSPVTIYVEKVCPWTDRGPLDLDERITDIIGPFKVDGEDMSWTGIIAVVLPLTLLVAFGPFNTGIGIISCGLSLTFIQALYGMLNITDFSLPVAGLGLLIVFFGVMYIMSKQGVSHL